MFSLKMLRRFERVEAVVQQRNEHWQALTELRTEHERLAQEHAQVAGAKAALEETVSHLTARLSGVAEAKGALEVQSAARQQEHDKQREVLRQEHDEQRAALRLAHDEQRAALLQAQLLGDQHAELFAKLSTLEAELNARPAPGTEEFDLLAAERQRDRMRRIQPHLANSTAGVFSYSQHQQELFALEHHGFKRNGFFIEIGVGTGKVYSNTYLLEHYFGWKGILCEPNPVYVEDIRANRSVIHETRAAYSVTGESVRFLCVPGIYGGLSTIADFVESDHHTRYGDEVEVQTISLEDLLTYHNAPRQIDYMSIDTEGSETAIIQNFDFNKWQVAVMTIEHNLVPGRVEQFDEILLPFGYERVLSDLSSVDAWYIRSATSAEN